MPCTPPHPAHPPDQPLPHSFSLVLFVRLVGGRFGGGATSPATLPKKAREKLDEMGQPLKSSVTEGHLLLPPSHFLLCVFLLTDRQTPRILHAQPIEKTWWAEEKIEVFTNGGHAHKPKNKLIKAGLDFQDPHQALIWVGLSLAAT